MAGAEEIQRPLRLAELLDHDIFALPGCRRDDAGNVIGMQMALARETAQGFGNCQFPRRIERRRIENFREQLDPPAAALAKLCLLYTSPSPRDGLLSRMPSSA